MPIGDRLSLNQFFEEAQLVMRRVRDGGLEVPPIVTKWLAEADLRAKDPLLSATQNAELVKWLQGEACERQSGIRTSIRLNPCTRPKRPYTRTYAKRLAGSTPADPTTRGRGGTVDALIFGMSPVVRGFFTRARRPSLSPIALCAWCG